MGQAKCIALATALLTLLGVSAKKSDGIFTTSAWFYYLSGPTNNPDNYVLSSEIPPCDGEEALCAVLVTKTSSNKAEATDLNALWWESSGFTVAGDFTHGAVKLKDYP